MQFAHVDAQRWDLITGCIRDKALTSPIAHLPLQCCNHSSDPNQVNVYNFSRNTLRRNSQIMSAHSISTQSL